MAAEFERIMSKPNVGSHLQSLEFERLSLGLFTSVRRLRKGSAGRRRGHFDRLQFVSIDGMTEE